jgi:3-methylfumaryl-CoA hydratase
VHGPLQALLMGECVRRAGLDASRFAYRLVRPTYGAQRLAAHATVRPDGVRLRVEDGSGRTTATGEAAPGAAAQ